MIKSLYFENFKGFEKFRIDFDRINLLVGGNNSGKTTIFHALQTIFWCFEKTADISDETTVFLRKTQVSEIGAFPYFDVRDIFYRQKMRTGANPTRITLSVKFSDESEYSFKIYLAFSRNLMIDGFNREIPKDEYNRILKNFKPVYVPSTIGITLNEELYRPISQERLISEGRQNEVLRNQLYLLSRNSDQWREFVQIISPIFKLKGIEIPFDETHDEWLSVLYKEEDCSFDCISAGSGFLQLLNLLVFLLLHESRVALLDEPDSHMHTDLQEVSFTLLRTLSERRNVQLMIATHSPTLIDSAELHNVLVIDKTLDHPLKVDSTEELIPLLSDQGISLPPSKIIDTLKSRRAIFVENNDTDYLDFFKIIGEKINDKYLSITRGLIVFETEGATKKWPFDAIAAFEKLLSVPLKYIYISDRDFATDAQLVERRNRIKNTDTKKIHFLPRRNRESYLCEPKILSRLLTKKWIQKNRDLAVPEDFLEEKIHNKIISKARLMEDDIRTTFLMEQDSYLRTEVHEKERRTLEINQYFRQNYTDMISENHIPFKLLDSKQVLKQMRQEITDNYHFSFTDKEILSQYDKDSIPTELSQIIGDILYMFER